MTAEIELKNVKYGVHKHGHDDGHNFTATVYKDGKRWCTATDDGWGAGVLFQPINGQEMEELDEEIMTFNATLGKRPAPYEHLDATLDAIVYDLVNDWLQLKEFKNITRGKTCVQEKDYFGTTTYLPYKVKFHESLVDELNRMHPECLILNQMNDEDAVKWMRCQYKVAA